MAYLERERKKNTYYRWLKAAAWILTTVWFSNGWAGWNFLTSKPYLKGVFGVGVLVIRAAETILLRMWEEWKRVREKGKETIQRVVGVCGKEINMVARRNRIIICMPDNAYT